jgi:nucleoside-diphosphate-sugar epimerase
MLIGSSGYIGSRFYLDHCKKYKITNVDFNLFYDGESLIKEDFSNLSKDFINKHDVIILLAGHSSIGMSNGDMLPVIENNFINFVNLSNKISSDKKFIYASSSSVYGMSRDVLAKENKQLDIAINNYDYTKQLIDSYSNFIKCNWFSLRFGTVNGWSPNFRNDIMINAMYLNYLKNNKIVISNPDINRPILGISDLCRSIDSIIENKKETGIYNLCSFNTTPKILGEKLSKVLKCSLEINKESSFAYDFKISNAKFKKYFNFKFKDTTESIVREIQDNYNNIKNIDSRKEYFNYVR